MLKRLLPNSEIEKAFNDCKIDKNHTMVTLKSINDLSIRYFKSKNTSAQKNVNINININHNKNNSINININDCNGSQVSPAKNVKKEELVRTVLKRIRSSSEVMRIKGLIVAHSITKKTFDEDFMEVIAEEMDKYIVEGLTNEEKNLSSRLDREKIDVKLDSTQKEFIERNIISFYSQYLKKFIINHETFRFA
jgi:predicted metal-binding transcription factor (methanogenesis marker protein 9)